MYILLGVGQGVCETPPVNILPVISNLTRVSTKPKNGVWIFSIQGELSRDHKYRLIPGQVRYKWPQIR
jgi:hypothetical protein